MGLLALGTPYNWEEGRKYADHVREHGITQFLNIWDRLKDREGDTLLWGDEVGTFVTTDCRHSLLCAHCIGWLRRSSIWWWVSMTKRRMPRSLYARSKSLPL
jgi:hypothetical protein